MKRMICLICVIVLLTGCGAADTSLERAMTLRSGLLNKGAAGDMCAEKIVQYGMLPTDMLDVLPRLMK